MAKKQKGFLFAEGLVGTLGTHGAHGVLSRNKRVTLGYPVVYVGDSGAKRA